MELILAFLRCEQAELDLCVSVPHRTYHTIDFTILKNEKENERMEEVDVVVDFATQYHFQ